MGEKQMNKCIKCGRFQFCKEAEENKKECDKFIKRKGITTELE